MRIDRWTTGSQGTWPTLGFVVAILAVLAILFLLF